MRRVVTLGQLKDQHVPILPLLPPDANLVWKTGTVKAYKSRNRGSSEGHITLDTESVRIKFLARIGNTPDRPRHSVPG